MADVICGFCKQRMDASVAERRLLGGRDVLYCPKCKGPCRPVEDVSHPVPPPLPAQRAPESSVASSGAVPPTASASAPDRPRLGLRAPPAASAEPMRPAEPPSSANGAERPRLGLRPPPAQASSGAPHVGVPASPLSVQSTTAPPAVAAAEFVGRIQQQAEARVQRETRRGLQVTRNPWSAFWFPLHPFNLLGVMLMVFVFCGQQMIWDMGLADDEYTGTWVMDESTRTPPAPAPSASAAASGKTEKSKRSTAKPQAASRPNQAAVAPPEGSTSAPVAAWFSQYNASGPYSPGWDKAGASGSSSAGSSLGLAAAAGFLMPGLLALGLTALMMNIFWIMYFAALLLGIIQETSNGAERFPRWPSPFDIVDSFLVPSGHFLVCLIVSFVPAFMAFWLPFLAPAPLRVLWMAAPFLLFAGILYFPMSLMCVAVRGEASAAMPRVVVPALAKAHIHYLPALLAFLALPGWTFLRGWVLGHGWKIWQVVLADYGWIFLFLVITVRALGVMHRRIEDRLAWNVFSRA